MMPPLGRSDCCAANDFARPKPHAEEIEEMDAVLDENAAADLRLPKPVPGAEWSVGSVVFKERMQRRAKRAGFKDAGDGLVQWIVAHDEVYGEKAARRPRGVAMWMICTSSCAASAWMSAQTGTANSSPVLRAASGIVSATADARSPASRQTRAGRSGQTRRTRAVLPRASRPVSSDSNGFSLVKFQQRYQMRNRILFKAVPALEFCPFCNSQKCAPFSSPVWGVDSDHVLQLVI
jgi:hypothetical protein